MTAPFSKFFALVRVYVRAYVRACVRACVRAMPFSILVLLRLVPSVRGASWLLSGRVPSHLSLPSPPHPPAFFSSSPFSPPLSIHPSLFPSCPLIILSPSILAPSIPLIILSPSIPQALHQQTPRKTQAKASSPACCIQELRKPRTETLTEVHSFNIFSIWSVQPAC